MEADEFQEVLPGVFFWQAYDPAVKTDLSSTAVAIGGELIFVDPIPLQTQELSRLVADYTPYAVVLTNGNHGRAAEQFRRRFGVPVIAHQAACDEIEFKVDQAFGQGASIAGLQTIELPGFGPGEIALYQGSGAGLILMGDALINVESHGFVPLPDKYCIDPKQGAASLEKLLQFSFEAMTFAHGLPIVSQARKRLERLLK